MQQRREERVEKRCFEIEDVCMLFVRETCMYMYAFSKGNKSVQTLFHISRCMCVQLWEKCSKKTLRNLSTRLIVGKTK